MPKQIHKIDQFHGGLSSNSDPRDIANNELSAATDIMVDELGKIRTMGGTTAHDAGTSTAVDIEPGFGLFQFSHDRIDGHLGEHLANGGDFSSNWTGGTGWNTDSTDASYAHSGSPGDLVQTAAQRLEEGVANVTYAFTYTLSGVADTITTLRILGTGNQFAAANTDLVKTNGTHRVTFLSHASDTDQPFTIDVASSGSAAFNIDNVSLVIAEAAETGDDYLVLADDESSDPALYIYSKNRGTWSATQTITMGDTNSFAPCFYYANGALRISDGNFGSTNPNVWYGYIKKTWFDNTGNSYKIDQWFNTVQSILPPSASYFYTDFTYSSNLESGSTDLLETSGGANVLYETRDDIANAFADPDGSIFKVLVPYTIGYSTWIAIVTTTIQAGPYDNDASAWLEGSLTQTYVTYNVNNTGGTEYDAFQRNIWFDVTKTDVGEDWGSGSGSDDVLRVEISISASAGAASVQLNNYPTVYESGAFPELDSGGDLTNGYASANNVIVICQWSSADGTGWNNAANEGAWKIGSTFVYDEEYGHPSSQESQITELLDHADGSTTTLNVPNDDLSPSMLIAVASPNDLVVGWNKRIVGVNIYVQNLALETTEPWFLLGTGSFTTGKFKVTSTGNEYDAGFLGDPANQSYYFWDISYTGLLSPPDVITYEDSSYISKEEISIVSKFKTAVVAGGRAYIGNVELQDLDGNAIEVKGDAMIRSPHGKLDVFPSFNRIEASVSDGDEIVKLEEYADRILQFKKRKMHLINVSQGLEILEETFLHKGVSHPSATCKTDFGIAWVNKFGCYLYDGKNVTNLLEKKGRQIIKESDWINFLTADKNLDGSGTDTELTPMIGYLPKKRQLVVFDDIKGGSTNDPRMFLYDIVTQSWVKGSDQGMGTRIIDIVKTNFTTDWNGDLVYAYTNGTVVKWNDASQFCLADDLEIITKDIDFGHPGVRKKVYKVYITYKTASSGSVIPNVNVDYDVDGGTTFPYDFQDGTNFTSGKLGAANGWQVAELKPDTTSESNNIKSFRLRIGKNSNIHTGTAQAGASTTITLDAGANASNDYYNGYVMVLNAGTGLGQVRTITDYVGSTKVATVATWGTNPDSSSEFKIGKTPEGFEVNDISIVYRLKPVK